MPLHLDYRPKSLNDFIGNKGMIASLKAVVERQDDLPHAWLFIGPKGCGKTSCARVIATDCLGCPAEPNNPDYQEINCGSHGKIDTVREIEKQALYGPVKSKNRVWVLDEAHMLGQGGASAKNPVQNALLKILEDAPKKGHLILCTTDPQRLIGTIHSRCHTFQVKTLSIREMQLLIDKVLKDQNVSDFPKDAIQTIIDAANGHPRDALKILDQVIDLEDNAIIEAIQSYKPDDAETKELIDLALNKGSWVRASDIINRLKTSGQDSEQVRRNIMAYISAIALNSKPSKRNSEDQAKMLKCKDIYEMLKHPTYNNGWTDIVFAIWEIVTIGD